MHYHHKCAMLNTLETWFCTRGVCMSMGAWLRGGRRHWRRSVIEETRDVPLVCTRVRSAIMCNVKEKIAYCIVALTTGCRPAELLCLKMWIYCLLYQIGSDTMILLYVFRLHVFLLGETYVCITLLTA